MIWWIIKLIFGVSSEATAADETAAQLSSSTPVYDDSSQGEQDAASDGTEVQHSSSTSSQGKQVTTDLSDADMVEILGKIKMKVFQSRFSQQIIGLDVDSLSQPPESEDLQAQLKAWNEILESETWRLEYHMGLIKNSRQP